MELLGKSIVILVLLGLISLFATDLHDIDKLVEKINSSKDVKEKIQLLNELDDELAMIDRNNLQKARDIVDEKLKRPIFSQN